jgi:hypothetical protein
VDDRERQADDVVLALQRLQEAGLNA